MTAIVNSIKQRIWLLFFLLLGIFGSIVGAVWMLVAIIVDPNGTRAKDIALGFDRLGNATTGGNGKETISSRAGRLVAENRGWACVLCKFLNWLSADHCKKSIGT